MLKRFSLFLFQINDQLCMCLTAATATRKTV